MGHVILMGVHGVALLVAAPLLLVTIPLHVVYAAQASTRRARTGDEPTPQTHVRCPDCRELVRMDARRCRHCGCALVPQQPG